jgi:hypothetical protein
MDNLEDINWSNTFHGNRLENFVIPIMAKEESESERRIKEIIKSYKKEIPMIKTIVINVFGGPGSGKSTITAQFFSELKWAGINCEMALEFATDKVWEGSEHVLENQPYIFGKQLHRMYRLNGKVNVIITDSPLPLSIVYDSTNNENFANFVIDKFEEFENKNYYIKRHKNYKTEGRLQNFEKAKELDNQIYNILVKYNIMFKEVEGNREIAKEIADEIIDKIKNLVL